MPEQHLYVDTAALRAAADSFDASAGALEYLAHDRLRRLRFGAASAGRVHAAGGDVLRQALDRWAGELAAWSRASTEIAVALRGGAQSYRMAELAASDGVG